MLQCELKSATMITDIVWGGKGREITYGSPILPNKYEAINVASSVMCVHVCALMSTQCLPHDTFISNVHIYLYIHCYQDAPWHFSVTSGSYNPHIQSAAK